MKKNPETSFSNWRSKKTRFSNNSGSYIEDLPPSYAKILSEWFNALTDEDAGKMPDLFQRLRKAHLHWETTGLLPNGKKWRPEKGAEKNE